MMSLLQQRPFHPWTFAAFPLLFIAAGNTGQVSAAPVLAAVAVAMVVVTLVWWLARLALGAARPAALVTLAFVVVFFAYGPVHTALYDANSPIGFLARTGRAGAGLEAHLVPTLVAILLVLLAGRLVARVAPRLSDERLGSLTGALNVMSVGLLLVQFWSLATAAVAAPSVAAEPPRPRESQPGLQTSVLGYNPDIYYVILDGYARADVLRDYYGFDNSPFIRALESRGFAVNEASSANYFWTFLSLTSSLNLDYLQGVMDAASPSGGQGYAAAVQRIRDNRASRFLRARGYRFHHLRSSWAATHKNPFADVEIGCESHLFEDEYLRALTEASWLRTLEGEAGTDLASCHLTRLRELGLQGSAPGPKFVFAHFLPPHHPYLFDRHGKVLRNVTITNQFDFQARLWEDRGAYLEQLRFVNDSMLAVVDEILRRSARPPIIILQSDHGPQLREGLPVEEQRRVRFANFAAFLLPGETAKLMPADVAPVNQFRYLFNHYFEAGFPILPQRSFVSAYGRPFQMEEFTPPRRVSQEIP